VKTYVFDGRVTALSSITHNGGQSYGINQMLRREKFVQTDNSIEEVPVISGNGFRGLLRDLGMLHMCRALGYGEPEKAGDKPIGLSLPAFYFLFSGGALTSDGGKALKLEEARRVRELIPLVGVFGGALGNHIMPGKLKMGKMIPIVRETAHLLPKALQTDDLLSIWDCCQREMYTRKDDEKNEKLRQIIAPENRLLIDQAKVEKRAQTDAGTPEGDTGQKQQMMYYIETLAAGTAFHLRITLDDVTDIEFEAFLTALVEFSRKPYIGGKSGTGMGEIRIKFDGWIEIDSRVAPQGRGVAWPAGTQYKDHLGAKAADIRAWLGAMA
jgi:CRISPR type IV-associated protein Csf2